MEEEKINYNNPFWIANFFTDFFDSDKGESFSNSTPEYQYIRTLLNEFKMNYCYMDYEYNKAEYSIISLDDLDVPDDFKLRKFTINFTSTEKQGPPYYVVNIWMVSNVIPNIIEYIDIYKQYIEADNADLVEDNLDLTQCSYLTFMGDDNDINIVLLEDLINLSVIAYEPFHLPSGKFNKLLKKDAIKDLDEKIILTNIFKNMITNGTASKLANLVMAQSAFAGFLIGNSLSVYAYISTINGSEDDENSSMLINDTDMILLAGIERAIMKERKFTQAQASVLLKRAFFDYICPSYTATDIEKEDYYSITKLIDLVDFINKMELDKKPYTISSLALMQEFKRVFKNKTQIE